MLKTSMDINAFCAYPFQRLKFSSDGYVTMCCFQTRKCLGNILKQKFEDIWFGSLAQEIRNETIQGRLHAKCQQPTCPFFHSHHLETETFVQKQYPTQFEIDLPMQHCNVGGENPDEDNPACIMCERHRVFEKQEDKLDQICEKIKKYVRFLDAIHIQGVSEPFWKNRIFEIIEILDIKPYKNKLRISTTTNGTLLNSKCRARFLKLPLSSLTWSIDASTPETFKSLRRWNSYSSVVNNLKNYAKERTPEQHLRIHNNINLININDVEGMVELAAETKVDCLEFNATYSVPQICVNKSNYKQFVDAQEKIIDLSNKLGVNTKFMRNLFLDYSKKRFPLDII